eukprot:5351821-Amphidinium_carterae.2
MTLHCNSHDNLFWRCHWLLILKTGIQLRTEANPHQDRTLNIPGTSVICACAVHEVLFFVFLFF